MTHKIYLTLQTDPHSRLLLSHHHLNKGYLRSTSMTKILLFLHQRNLVLPIAFSSPLMTTHYFRLLRPKTWESSLTFVSHTEISSFSKSYAAFKIHSCATSHHLHHCRPDPAQSRPLQPSRVGSQHQRQVMLKNGKLDHVLHLFKILTIACRHPRYLLSPHYSNVLETFDYRVRCLKVSNVFTTQEVRGFHYHLS